ncbi:hypothetical protein, partial [Ornithinibacillus sp. JPR2-1]|uniref:hypothetical protein n=1 Tax=Ornithinibacillus sp. JPR2-1 TaxID=2094019 RepID=UPI0031D09D56
EDVQAEIDEAKQEAERAKQEAQQAKTTADGKNSVFTQSTQPSITGRKIGDVWFDTSRDNLMYRFNGTQWVEAKWGEQSIVANSITANHIKSLVGLNVNDQFIVDSNGNVKFAGHLEGASGSFTGTVNAKAGYFGDNLSLVNGKLRISRPDGAVWMQDGMVKQDFNVTSVDPYDMDYVNLSGNLIDGVFRASRGFYRAGYEAIVGGGDYRDIRDPDKGWSVKFTTYEFVHSARYLVIGYRKGINVTNPRHNTQVWEGDNRLYIEWHEPGGRPNQAPIIIDLGTPTYEVRNFQLRIGVNKSDVSGNNTIIFRIDRVFLTDDIPAIG